MTGGLTRAQLGVTDAMIASYGETIFKHSNNHQIRRGDPIRLRDFTAIEAHRHELGMSDAQIAERLGLNPTQVTFIRNMEERRRFRTGHYHMLNRLGGGKRFRAERMTPYQDHFRYSEDALAMRAGLAFDPARVRAYVEGGYWRNDTLRGWLVRQAKTNPAGKAVVDASGAVTYGDVARSVEALAGGLYQAGVRPGDVVAVQLFNTLEYVESFLAISWLGAVMTTLYTTFREAELATQLRHSKARALIAASSFGPFSPPAWAQQQKESLPSLKSVIAVGAPVKGALAYKDLLNSGVALPADVPEPTAADPFLLLYTSGTTSSPKGVPLNSHQMLTNARLGTTEHNIRVGDIVLSAAPFGHLYALYSVKMALCAGAAVALLPQFSPTDLTKCIEGQRPTHLFAGPAHLAACEGAGLLARTDLSSLRLVVLSGAAVPPDLVRTVEPRLHGGSLCQLWGMTELQAGLYTRLSDAAEIVATTAGRPSPGTEVRIADEKGASVPTGEEGELQVCGPSVFVGYYANPEATAQAFTTDGWFRSGDVARMDGAGNVTLSGRTKDVINRGGVKYNPQEIELLIERMPGVAQCAIAPVSDPRLGERACCYLVPRPGAQITLKAIGSFLLAQGIAKYKLPEQLELRTELPMTATRKVIKGHLKPQSPTV